MRTTHKPNRHTRGGASRYTTIQQELWPESTHLHASSPTAAGLAAPGPTPAGITLVAVFRGANTWVLGGGASTATTPPITTGGAYHCYLSLRSALETGDRRAFRERTAACLCIPFHSGLNMRRAHHRKNKQTPTSLSFFFISFFLLFAPNLKELRVSAD